MHAAVSAIEYFFPEAILSTTQLAAEFPEWSRRNQVRDQEAGGSNPPAPTTCLLV
jgi:hypothetical protein